MQIIISLYYQSFWNLVRESKFIFTFKHMKSLDKVSQLLFKDLFSSEIQEDAYDLFWSLITRFTPVDRH